MPDDPDRPAILDYGRPQRAPPRPRRFFAPDGSILWLVVGVLSGAAFSGLVWILGWKSFTFNGFAIAVFAVPAAKVIVGTLCTRLDGYRSFGVGVLLSLALGVLIFAGTCYSSLSRN